MVNTVVNNIRTLILRNDNNLARYLSAVHRHCSLYEIEQIKLKLRSQQ